jgi:dolichol-phosphate mannosyltransferase
MSTTAARAIVVVPTYNERENLPALVDGLMAHPNVSVLVVDDNSPDGTAALAHELRGKYPARLRVLERTGPRGLGRSYIDGLKLALDGPAELICQMDADFSHDPAQLPRLIEAASAFDVVIGSRYIPGGKVVNWPLHRRLLSRVANMYVHTVTRLSARDCTSGYRCWRRDALAAMPLDRFISEGYSFLVEMLYVANGLGSRIGEVPITFVERRLGASKMSRGVMIESAIAPWRLIGRDS